MFRLRSYNMLFTIAVKACNAFNCHVVRFCSTRSENDFFCIAINQLRNLTPCMLHACFCIPTVFIYIVFGAWIVWCLELVLGNVSGKRGILFYLRVRLCGLPKRCIYIGIMASKTLGSIGVVAWLSKYDATPGKKPSLIEKSEV